ncbi:type VI immunity family protein [Luteimonas sp. R10]|uniref:type VI immunity family protein n=1 Tax=Luteimonas sp. R10 TaxID=3108176 RepID=UPI00308AE269|nr:type VI immunity family protein [Luteimonas sp. R10]
MAEAHLDPKRAAELDGIELTDGRGNAAARIGFALELYFTGGETVETRLALCEILRDYHGFFSTEISHYLKVDANRPTRISDEVYLDYYEEQARALNAQEPFDATVFGYPQKKIVDEPTPVSISFAATGPEPLSPRGLSHLCAYFSAGFMSERGYGFLVDIVKRWAARLNALHGSAGYSVLFEHGIFGGHGVLSVLPALKRFPGLDFSDPGMFIAESAGSDGKSIKSINWLTVLCDEFTGRLGAHAGLEAKLKPACLIHEYDGGIVIQAGDQPQLGDVNHGIVLDGYRRVAEALKPIRFEAYRRGLFVLSTEFDELEETGKWLARFEA